MMRIILSITAICLMFAACAPASHANWAKPNIPEKQKMQDWKECDYEGLTKRGSSGNGITDGLRHVEIREACMGMKGYSKIKE